MDNTRFKKTIFHIDADSFFASVERAMHPEWGAMPVCVTALQGGCILACTYEMKRQGVKTGMPVWEAKKKMGTVSFQACLANFHAYSRYAEHMFGIFREYTPDVEEYSIDEAFLDMTGLRSLYRKSYEDIALDIQHRVWKDLGLPVSVGIADTKILAKMASKRGKPKGIYRIRSKQRDTFLAQSTFEDVPGIGFQSEALLQKYRITTVADFLRLSEEQVQKILHKPGVLTWKELQGFSVLPFVIDIPLPQSVSRIRSFPLTTNYAFLESQAIQHIVLCMEKVRRKGLLATHMSIGVRDRDYVYQGKEYLFKEAHCSTECALKEAMPDFPDVVGMKEIRSVYVCYSGLVEGHHRPLSLFGDTQQLLYQEETMRVVDGINHRFGPGTIRTARLARIPAQSIDAPEYLKMPYLGEVGEE